MTGLGLQKTKPSYDKRQDTTSFNWGSNRQTERGKVF